VYWIFSSKLFGKIKASSWTKIRRLRGKHLEDPIKEIQAMQLIGNYHSHFVSYIDAMQDDHMLYNIMQYCEDGDFYGTVMSEINTNDRVDEDRARIWFRQLMLALHHLQQKGVCHRDLSLENIIVHKKSVKIIDFGLALRVPYKSNRPDDNDNMRCVTDVSEGKSRLLMTAQGQGSNWGYMSPEVLAKEKHFDGFAHDLWATGVILYILLVGHKPFHWAHKSDKEFLQIAENRSLKESLVYWGINLSDDAYDLLQNMLQRNPRQRLTLAQVMQHPWVRGSKEKEPEICDSVKENIKAGKSNWFQKKKEKCKGKNRK
jgi:serine/threonine protein kinase